MPATGSSPYTTGAGLSADSGIPTFRDVDGFWTVGSKTTCPRKWVRCACSAKSRWTYGNGFCTRNTICSKALPNRGHYAVTELEQIFGDRFRLITQNVWMACITKAGTSEQRASSRYPRKGALRRRVQQSVYPAFRIFLSKEPGIKALRANRAPKCPKCGEYLRPHTYSGS